MLGCSKLFDEEVDCIDTDVVRDVSPCSYEVLLYELDRFFFDTRSREVVDISDAEHHDSCGLHDLSE